MVEITDPIGIIGAAPETAPGGFTFPYLFDAIVAGSPPSGRIRVNNAALGSVTIIHINETDNASNDIASFLAKVDDSPSSPKGSLKIFNKVVAGDFAIYDITGNLTDNGDNVSIPVTFVNGSVSTFSTDTEISLTFDLTGGAGTGDVQGPATATANAIPRYDGTSGKLIQNSGAVLDASDNLTGINNIFPGGTVDGRDLATDGGKLDGVESLADVTDAANVNAAGAVMETDYAAKGSLLAASAASTPTNLPVGANGEALTADSAQATGVKWQQPALAALARITGSTFSTIQEMQDVFHSTGWVSGGIIADAGSGNITVAAGTGLIRPTASATAEIQFMDWSALGSTAIPADTIRYIGVEYNAGAPQVIIKSTDTWDYLTEFPIGIVVNEGGTLHIFQNEQAVGDHAATMIRRNYETMPLHRDERTGGIIISNTGTRNVAVTAGALWDRLNRFVIAALDTSGADTFDTYHDDGASGFTKLTGESQWNNTQFDNGSGTLAALTVNRFTNRWFYIESDGDLVCVFGSGEFNSLAAAEAQTVPSSVPDRLIAHGTLIGRIIAQQGTDTPGAVQSAFVITFSLAAATDHGNLAGLPDDDHLQYLLEDGTRAMSGGLNMGANAITNVGNVDGVDVSAHAARHTSGADDVQNATAAQKGLATAAQITKLDAIEALADVTDTANVNAAGAVMETDYTAKGSLLAASAASTPANLAVGSNDEVLTADSAQATGMKWAGPPIPGVWTQLGKGPTSVANSSEVTVLGSTTISDGEIMMGWAWMRTTPSNEVRITGGNTNVAPPVDAALYAPVKLTTPANTGQFRIHHKDGAARDFDWVAMKMVPA